MSTVFDLVKEVCKNKGAKFASFIYRAKGTGELSRIQVILGASTEALYLKDIAQLEEAMVGMVDGSLEKIAAQAILDSRRESLEVGIGHNSAYTCEDVYVTVNNNTQGVKVHTETGRLYVVGLMEHKTVLEPGVYKQVNSAPLTIAKNKIRRDLPSSRFRQYIFDNVTVARLNGEVLEIEGDVQVAN